MIGYCRESAGRLPRRARGFLAAASCHLDAFTTASAPIQDNGDSMHRLTLSDANTIIDASLGVARKRSYPPLAIVVLDEAGHIRAVQREDGASMFRVDVATGKALAAASMGGLK